MCFIMYSIDCDMNKIIIKKHPPSIANEKKTTTTTTTTKKQENESNFTLICLFCGADVRGPTKIWTIQMQA